MFLEKKKIIAGVDEVGRGSLFGPVFAGAVILNDLNKSLLLQAGLKDSKELSRKTISSLIPLIIENSQAWGLGQASAREIDAIGIRAATEKAMIRALQRLNTKPELVLVDGNLAIREWKGPQLTLIKGDKKSASIAAASVLAKGSRDDLIKRLSKKFPGYSLHTNVGYGSEKHRESIRNYGPTKLHRLSFLKKIIIEE
tara:strand:- start:2023 stop:2616 length:594 start_codon:yes stop_codon:yes gene_type:complete